MHASTHYPSLSSFSFLQITFISITCSMLSVHCMLLYIIFSYPLSILLLSALSDYTFPDFCGYAFYIYCIISAFRYAPVQMHAFSCYNCVTFAQYLENRKCSCAKECIGRSIVSTCIMLSLLRFVCLDIFIASSLEKVYACVKHNCDSQEAVKSDHSCKH